MDIINGRPSNRHEKSLRDQGWMWVNTNTINPTQSGRNTAVADPNGRPDRLGEHSHHGESTHSVISGDLRIRRSLDGFTYEISSNPDARRQDQVPPYLKYSATSRNGCTFVEGHKCLSPESAERFISRGTLRIVDKKGRRHFPTNNQLGAWLRQVRFNPKGTAHPDLRRGEVPILDASEIYPPIPDDIYYDLSEWFEVEWKGPRRRQKMQRAFWFLLSCMILAWCVLRIT